MPRWTADSITWAHTSEGVRGSVADYLTGEMLEGVTLFWERSTLVTRSSAAGHFLLPVGDTAGVRTLQIRRIGYLPHRVAVRLVAEWEHPGPGAVHELSVRLVPEVPPPCSVWF